MQQNWKFRRGDIYYVQFGNTSTGSEQHGDRPAVIIQNDVGNTYAPTLIVVPLTSNTEKKVTQPTHCLLENEGLSMSSMALAEQIFTIDKSRILKSAQRRCPLLHIKTTAFIHNRSYNLMIDKFSQVAENLPAADRDADRQYHVINGYPVVFSFSKEPNPEAFERIRNILLATSYTKKVG